MAFFAPALRWPDALGIDITTKVVQIQPKLPSPLRELSPDLLFSLLVSFSVIVLITLTTAILQARHPKTALPVLQGRSKSRRKDPIRVMLAGPSGMGKTSLFSAMAFKSVPSVHPSQRGSETLLSMERPSGKPSDLVNNRPVVLIDTPGHPRIKDAAITEYIDKVDMIVFCVDAKEALRGNAGIGLATQGSLMEAVDHLHQILIQLAKRRLNKRSRSNERAPTLVVLLTRADLSPHSANISLSSLSLEEGKRRAILLGRARTAIEVELGRRRSGMGFGARRTTKVGGMSKVMGSSDTGSVWSSVKSILGLSRSGVGGAPSSGSADDEEEDEELIDYVDWDVQDRLQALTNSSSDKGPSRVSAGTSLEQLDADVVDDGKALFAFASVGKERGWDERDLDGLNEVRRIIMDD